MSNASSSNTKLTELIEEFKLHVQKESPTNLVQFAADYFTDLYYKESFPNKESSNNILDDDDSSTEEEDNVKEIMTDKKSKMKLLQSSNVSRQSIICEPFDPSSIDNETFEKNRKTFPKTPKQLDKITEILQTIFLFNCLDEEQIIKVIESMFFIEVFKGDEIIKENDPGDNFYVIDHGTFTASNKSKTIYEEYRNEGFFGELALLYNCPRIASVTANTDGGLWAIDRITFRQLILKSAYQKRKKFLNFIKSVPILEELSEYDQCNLADALKTRIVNNEKIISEGGTGDKMYFIEEGKVLVTVKCQNEEQEKGRLKAGDYFGEVALLAKIPRIASVYAIGVTKLAELDAKSYTRLMGPCIDRMRSNFSKYQSQLEQLFSKNQLQELFPDMKIK